MVKNIPHSVNHQVVHIRNGLNVGLGVPEGENIEEIRMKESPISNPSGVLRRDQ